MSEQQIIEALIAAAPGIRNGNYGVVTGSTWFVYDWAISLDQEINFIWTRKLSTGSLLYIANRVVSTALLIIHFQTSVRPLDEAGTRLICRPFIWVLFYCTLLSTAIVQTVLSLRTYALWDCNKAVLWGLMFLNFGGLAAQGILTGIKAGSTQVIFNPLPEPYTGCVTIFGDWTWQRNIPIMIFEISVAALMLTKFFQMGRDGRGSQVAYVLYRDGFLEFSAVIVSTVFSTIVEIIMPGGGDLYTASFDFSPIISMIACARMLLNIRDVMSLSNEEDEATIVTKTSGDPSIAGSGSRDTWAMSRGGSGSGRGRNSGGAQGGGGKRFIEVWEMGSISVTRKRHVVRDPLEFDEEAFEAEVALEKASASASLSSRAPTPSRIQMSRSKEDEEVLERANAIANGGLLRVALPGRRGPSYDGTYNPPSGQSQASHGDVVTVGGSDVGTGSEFEPGPGPERGGTYLTRSGANASGWHSHYPEVVDANGGQVYRL